MFATALVLIRVYLLKMAIRRLIERLEEVEPGNWSFFLDGLNELSVSALQEQKVYLRSVAAAVLPKT